MRGVVVGAIAASFTAVVATSFAFIVVTAGVTVTPTTTPCTLHMRVIERSARKVEIATVIKGDVEVEAREHVGEAVGVTLLTTVVTSRPFSLIARGIAIDTTAL